MLLPFFQLSLAIRNVWPQRMSMKAFIALYMPLLLAGMPVTLLSCIPYDLFAIPAAVCIYGLITCRDTAAQNVCMGMIGFILTIVTVNLLTPLSSISQRYISFGVNLIYTFLFYLITLFCGRLLKKTATIRKRRFTLSADLVSDWCRITALDNHLSVWCSDSGAERLCRQNDI